MMYPTALYTVADRYIFRYSKSAIGGPTRKNIESYNIAYMSIADIFLCFSYITFARTLGASANACTPIRYTTFRDEYSPSRYFV